MKGGAWISGLTGHYEWVHDHAKWIVHPLNAHQLGVPSEVQQRLLSIPSPHTPAGRREVLLTAIGAELIRVRGHGVTTTFEATLPVITILEAALPFIHRHLGPWMTCQINQLDSGESWAERVGIILPCDDAPTVTPRQVQNTDPSPDGCHGGDA